jgi:tryptophan 2,3-dioxygenase
MHSKKSKASNAQISQGFEVNAEAIKYLRTVNPSESFHFYEAIGKPTGQSASNLTEFLETVKSVKTESLQFHLERKDFQKWIEKTLGDKTLARRITKTGAKHEGNIRAKIQSTLQKRIKELAEPNLTMMVDTEQTVTSRKLEA